MTLPAQACACAVLQVLGEGPVVEFRILGALNLLGAGGRELSSVLAQPKRVALLAYLAAATPRRLHRRDSLLALFWPELDQEHARAALRQALHGLRHALSASTQRRSAATPSSSRARLKTADWPMRSTSTGATCSRDSSSAARRNSSNGSKTSAPG